MPSMSKVKVGFLPYKASMWDAMSSVWAAATSDSRVEAVVLPLPVEELSPAGEAVRRYVEADLGVGPVEDVEQFDLHGWKPDILYLHNVYDEFNRVTRVDPRFHTGALRRLASQIVYLPYYAMGGRFGPGQEDLPGYANVDKIVVQTDEYVPQIGAAYRDKAVSLGSAKVDHALSAFVADAPSSDATVLLLVTSLTELFRDGNGALRRIADVLDFAMHSSDVRVIWRPHPLTVGSLIAMRTDLATEFSRLLRAASSIPSVELDLTADYRDCFARSHGCLALSATSLPLLFGVSGRPVLFLSATPRPSRAAVGASPAFGDVAGGHPWACNDVNGDVDLTVFAAYCRSSRHDMQEQRRRLARRLGPLDGQVGRRIHEYTLNECAAAG